MKKITLAFAATTLLGFHGSSQTTLKNIFSPYFTMGVAISPASTKTDEANLIINQFGSVTAENAMKMGPIHPMEDQYSFAGGDTIAAFAKRNGLKMRGHTLCWHNQTPTWMFKDSSGNTVSKEELLKRLKIHITNVVRHYKGYVYAWDVVNEVISDNPNEFYRKSPWLEICGEEFIEKAFLWAHDADPDALLFYNDYNEINDGKRAKIITMIRALQKKGIPIHGVGLQGHWAISEPSKDQLDRTLKDFSTLGIDIQITELDISVYPKEHNAREKNASDYNTDFTPEKEMKQVAVYKDCFELFRKYSKQIKSVTFWNISDRRSWLDNFPVKGRKDYPLLFDKDLQPKKAFAEVISF